MTGFWQRVKQSKLAQWSAAYIAASFALIQVLDVVAQRFGWPDRIEKLIILALAVGFFVALVLAWYHGERGAQRVGGPELLIIALLLAIGGGVLWGYARVPAKVPVAVAAANPSRSPDAAQRNPRTALPDSTATAVSSGLRTASATSPLPASTAAIPEKSVAVLPFANESGKKDEQYFSDGLSEDLITALSQFGGLKVISRNSAFQFRDSKDSSAEIGAKLGVAHLLEGTVQHAGDEVRITATLVNASDGSTLWSEHYDRPYKDLFALQDAITQAVAGALQVKLLTAPGAVAQSDRPPSGNLDAYTAYQHGIAFDALGTEVSERRAADAFGEAIRVDPRYAAAYAQMSHAWIDLAAQFVGEKEAVAANAKARDAVNAALQLDPESSLAHRAHAFVLINADMDWAGAEAEYRRALQLAPNDAHAKFGLGMMLATLGQVRQAVELIRQGLVADPRNARRYQRLSSYLVGLGQLDDARQAINTGIALQPGVLWLHLDLTLVEILRGDAKAALATAQHETPGFWRDTAMTLALQIGPDRAPADAALKKLIARYAASGGYQIAEVYALRRDPYNMFKRLDRAWSNRDPGIQFLLYDPFILRYKNDPRFAALAKKVGLPATTDAVAMK